MPRLGRYYRLSGAVPPLERYCRCGGTVLPLVRYCRCAGTVLPPDAQFHRFLPHVDPYLLCLFGFDRSFWLFCVSVCLVPGDEHPEQQVRRVNPGRSTSKRYRTSEATGGSSSAQPPPVGASSSANPPRKKKIASRPKPSGKKVTEMSSKEFWDRRRRNPYEEEQEPNLVNRPF